MYQTWNGHFISQCFPQHRSVYDFFSWIPDEILILSSRSGDICSLSLKTIFRLGLWHAYTDRHNVPETNWRVSACVFHFKHALFITGRRLIECGKAESLYYYLNCSLPPFFLPSLISFLLFLLSYKLFFLSQSSLTLHLKTYKFFEENSCFFFN